MKKIYLLTYLFCAFLIHAQNVGINTTDPKRNLDLNGNLKISTLNDKSNDSNFSELMVTEKDNGYVDKINIPALDQSEIKNVEISRTIYLSTTPDEAKTCSCGDINFRINNSNTAQIKLNNNTPLTDLSATGFTFGYGVKAWNNQAFAYYDRKGTTALSFNTTDFSTYKTLDSNTFNASANTIKIYTIILPGQNNLYRLTLSRLLNTGSTHIFSLICEKFYTQTI